MLNHNTGDMSAVYGLENKAIKFFWHCVSLNKRRSEERELQKCVVHWRPISSIGRRNCFAASTCSIVCEGFISCSVHHNKQTSRVAMCVLI